MIWLNASIGDNYGDDDHDGAVTNDDGDDVKIRKHCL